MASLNVVFARVDNRLLHGIVVTQYYPSTGAKRIMVIVSLYSHIHILIGKTSIEIACI